MAFAISSLVVFATQLGWTGATSMQPVETTPAAAAPASGSPLTAEGLLDLMEKADANLRSLAADIQYDKLDGVTGDRQVRRGKVFFEDRTAADAKPGQRRDRRFSVRFDTLYLGDVKRDEQQLFVFDGEWLTEVTPHVKQIIKRQVMPPGASFDPLKIGEGPLPLPIGQKKSDMLARFKVSLLRDAADLEGETEEETTKLKAFVKDSFQLKLVPNPGTSEAEKFAEIRLWYREGSAEEGGKRLLPRMARTLAPKSGNIAIVRMINVKTNTPIEPSMMAADTPGADWNVVVEALPQAVDAGPKVGK